MKELVLESLVEHWGFLDPTKNPDLDDIVTSYVGGTFLVAIQNSTIVGCGALIPISALSAQIVRMSTKYSHRRMGIGTLVLNSLIYSAIEQGFREVNLETTATWDDAVSFYLNHGFEITHKNNGDIYFLLKL